MCLPNSSKMAPRALFTIHRAWTVLPEGLDVFHTAVGCEWAQGQSVCGSCGASAGPARPVHTDLLRTGSPFLSWDQHAALDSTSHLSSNTEENCCGSL